MSITHSPEVAIAKMDCMKNREFCRSKLVFGVPYIMVFVKDDDKPFYYEGPKAAEDTIVWISSVTGTLELLA